MEGCIEVQTTRGARLVTKSVTDQAVEEDCDSNGVDRAKTKHQHFSRLSTTDAAALVFFYGVQSEPTCKCWPHQNAWGKVMAALSAPLILNV